MVNEETVTIRISKSLIEEIRNRKPDWQSVNATLIVDIVLRKYTKELEKREG